MHGNKQDKRSVRTWRSHRERAFKASRRPRHQRDHDQKAMRGGGRKPHYVLFAYTSVFDVLENIREEIITRILKNYTVHKFPHGSEAYTDFLTAVREETERMPMLEEFLANSKEAAMFTQDLKYSFYERLHGALVKEASEDKKECCAYVTVFLCSGRHRRVYSLAEKRKGHSFRSIVQEFFRPHQDGARLLYAPRMNERNL